MFCISPLFIRSEPHGAHLYCNYNVPEICIIAVVRWSIRVRIGHEIVLHGASIVRLSERFSG